MSGELVVMGFFKGRYKTDQGVALGGSDLFPESNNHKVVVYDGIVTKTNFFKEYTPEQYKKLSSFELKDVPNIEIESGQDAPFQDTRVYSFKNLILIEPRILSSHELNGQTYGTIEGELYGITEAFPSVKRLKPDDYSGGKTSVTPISPSPSDYDPIPDPFITKVGDIGNDLKRGCLDNFWRIFKYLFWILFFLFLIKTCNKINSDKNVCDRADWMEYNLQIQKHRIDSISSGMDEMITQSLANISVIYFYQNTADFHISSKGVNSTLDRLLNIMKIFPDRRFLIIGHHSGAEIENINIDEIRAKKVVEYFTKSGFIENRFDILKKGDSELKTNKNVLHDFEGRGFNRNMRVEIRLIKTVNEK